MDQPVAANIFGTLGAVLWSLQLLPQIWKNWRRHDSQSLSATFFMSWAVAGVPLGVYNIANDFNIALQVQPNILIFLSLCTWSQCKHYGSKWTIKKVFSWSVIVAVALGATEAGLVFALRVARDRDQDWASTLMAVIAAILLAGGVLRHYVDMLKTRSDAGLSLRFAILDASGDVASLLSVFFQPSLSVLGLVIYGSELAIWLGLISILLYFRAKHGKQQATVKSRSKSGTSPDLVSSRQHQGRPSIAHNNNFVPPDELLPSRFAGTYA